MMKLLLKIQKGEYEKKILVSPLNKKYKNLNLECQVNNYEL